MTIATSRNSVSDLAEFGRSREELDFWLGCTGAPLVVVEKHALTVRCANRNAEIFFGMKADDFSQCPIERLVGASAANMLGQIWSNAPVGIPGEPFLIRALVIEQERLLMVQVTKLIVEGELLRLFTFTDAPPQGSVALAGWQENVIAMLDWLPFGFEIATADEQIQFANSQFNELFGYSQHEIACIEDWWRLVYPDPDYREFAKTTWERLVAEARAENREMTPFDLEVTVKGGGKRTIQFRQRSIGNFNVNLYLDVTRERAYARELKLLAETDPLTGTMNRRRFFEEAERLYQDARPGRTAGILMLDIDNFKQINDRHGHGRGDLVLKEFTRRCRSVVGSGDILARLGGEEFIVLLADTSTEGMADVAERLRNQIRSAPFSCDEAEIEVTVSIGAALRLQEETTVEPTVSRADKALYAAKHQGRDCVVLASSRVRNRAPRPGDSR